MACISTVHQTLLRQSRDFIRPNWVDGRACVGCSYFKTFAPMHTTNYYWQIWSWVHQTVYPDQIIYIVTCHILIKVFLMMYRNLLKLSQTWISDNSCRQRFWLHKWRCMFSQHFIVFIFKRCLGTGQQYRLYLFTFYSFTFQLSWYSNMALDYPLLQNGKRIQCFCTMLTISMNKK